MTYITKSILTILSGVLLAQNSSAATFEFTQGGWAFGGPLSLSFTGQDENADGRIEQLELSAFHAAYKPMNGNPIVWSIEHIQPDGFFFLDPNNLLTFASNPEYSLIEVIFEGEALATIFDANLFPIDNTDQLPAAVPEPVGLTWVGLALLSYKVGRSRMRRISLAQD